MIVAFAGPSIYPSSAVRAEHPGIVWRGPAQQGDISTAVKDGATAIGLIDGLYGTLAAVWHKEILYALAEGVCVIGGASIGALRAVECEAFGMEGVGAVYEQYRSGVNVDDGDVALLHAPAELDFGPLTETLVDLEATLVAIAARSLVADDEMLRIRDIARRTYFWERTLEFVLGRTEYRQEESERLIGVIEANRVNLKRSDALAVIDRLEKAETSRASRQTDWHVNMTRSYRRIAASQTSR